MSGKWLTAVPQLPRAHTEGHVPWDSIESGLASFGRGVDLVLEPEYQRGHVWGEAQQRAYVEYQLAGGEVGKSIIWNCPSWPMSGPDDRMELVDGLQRLTAVRRFIAGDLTAYGMRYERGDTLRHTHLRFEFRVCCLQSPAEVLRLYLNINAGGTPHTAAELDRVRAMLEAVEP